MKESKYENITNKEIDDYLKDLSALADENPISSLLSIRNAFLYGGTYSTKQRSSANLPTVESRSFSQ